MGNIVHRNNALKDKMVASNVLMGLGNDSTDTVEKRIRDLEEGGGGSGSVVVVTPLLDEGVHIADISVNGRVSELYAPEGGGGTVTDVLVDGASVVNQDGEAEIDLSGKQDKLVAGTNIQIGQDGKTISATDTTYSDFVGATSQQAGTHGLVPAPLVTEKDKFLKGDGTWGEAGGGNVDDVVMNGQSIVDANKIASFNNYVELTRAEWEALPNSKYSDGILYCIKDSGSEKSNFFSPIIYSLAEREVGVWTDGKPLYQITLVWHNTELNQWVQHNISELDMDSLCYIEGYVNRVTSANSVFIHPLQYRELGIQDTYAASCRLKNDNTASRIDIYNALPSGNSSNLQIVTIQYTKTTDNPGTGKWTTSGVPSVHYSTEEQVIGTWIDGKTLYEKSYYVNSPVGQSNGYIHDPTLANVKYVIKSFGKYQRNVYSGGTILYTVFDSLDSYENNNLNSFLRVVKISTNTSEIGIVYRINGASSSDLSNLCVTIQYTKTTD